MNPLALFTGPLGFVYKWLAIAALAAAAMGWAYIQGISRESDRRDAIELKAVKQEHDLHAKAVAYGVDQARKAQANQAAADDYQQKWRRARDEAKRTGTPLAVADCPAVDPKPPAAGSGLANPGPGIRLRLTWEFVGLWDSAYTASDGQPLFGDTARAEKGSAGPGTASPYTVDDVLETHQTNAARFDACRRQLRALNATIDGLERAWAAARPGR